VSLHTRVDIAQAVVDNVVEGIIVINGDGLVQYFNPAAERMFGVSSAEILGKNVSTLMPSPHREKHDQYIASYVRAGEARIIGIGREVEGRRGDDQTFPMDLSVAKTLIDGKTYFVGVVRDISERKESEAIMDMNSRVSRAINKALGQFISASLWSKKELFDDILDSLLGLTSSEYGFIGEVHHGEEGLPYLKTHAITNIAWNHETRKLYKENARQCLEFRNLNTLFGVTVRTGELVIANEPSRDSRGGGLPPGHPGLHTYMGLPIYAGNKFLGMAGIANRPEGYDEELADLLKPFIGTIGSIIAGFQNLETRRKAEQDLYRAQQKLRLLATQDALTELPNRHSLMDSIEDAFKRSRDLAIPFSVLFIDVDHFKRINDTWGHRAGDDPRRLRGQRLGGRRGRGRAPARPHRGRALEAGERGRGNRSHDQRGRGHLPPHFRGRGLGGGAHQPRGRSRLRGQAGRAQPGLCPSRRRAGRGHGGVRRIARGSSFRRR
jgi:PAS domain S-box-containing protein